jgi:selenocysteine lyase/cysteine desulfurase
MDNGRKKFLQQLGAAAVITGIPNLALPNSFHTMIDETDFTATADPADEKYWKHIAKKYYDVSRDYINLENGYYGVQPKPVLAAFQKNIEKANKEATRFSRKEFPALQASIKKELAGFLGVSDEEIIITRNATEALNIAIQGYPFKEGDEVLLNQLDYFSMIETFRMLEKHGKISVKSFEMPLHPASDEEIVEVYKSQIGPKTKLILLTHLSNINGLIVPVTKISEMAKQKGIDIICDSAHALGHIPFSVPMLGPDFIGFNLHKWIGNPVGAGVLFVRNNRIKELKPLFGDVNTAENKIEKLAHFGTTPFAVIMTIPDSIAFHKLMGIQNISPRLKYLSETWMNEFKNSDKVDIVSPGGSLSCGIASFRIKDKTAGEVADYLYKDHKILTIGRALGKQGCVRVTPGIYSSVSDIREFIAAVRTI